MIILGDKMVVDYIKKLILILLIALTCYVIFLVFPSILTILRFVFKVLFPFIAAFALSFILQPVVCWFQKRLKSRTLAVIVVLFIFIAILIIFVSTTFPKLMNELKEFIIKLPEISEQLEQLVNNFAKRFDFLPINYQPTFDNLNNFITKYITNLSDVSGKAVSKILSFIGIFLLIPMILIHFLIDYEKIIVSFREYLVKKNRTHFKDYLGELNQAMSSYFRGTFLVMLLLTVAASTCFLFAKLDFALFFGILIGITNIIPYLGPYIGAIFPVLYALLESPKKAIAIIVIIFVLQTIESNFVTPYIQSRQTKTHPLLVLLALSLFGALFGILGMMIAVPLLSIIRITLKYYPLKKIKLSKT